MPTIDIDLGNSTVINAAVVDGWNFNRIIKETEPRYRASFAERDAPESEKHWFRTYQVEVDNNGFIVDPQVAYFIARRIDPTNERNINLFNDANSLRIFYSRFTDARVRDAKLRDRITWKQAQNLLLATRGSQHKFPRSVVSSFINVFDYTHPRSILEALSPYFDIDEKELTKLVVSRFFDRLKHMNMVEDIDINGQLMDTYPYCVEHLDESMKDDLTRQGFAERAVFVALNTMNDESEKAQKFRKAVCIEFRRFNSQYPEMGRSLEEILLKLTVDKIKHEYSGSNNETRFLRHLGIKNVKKRLLSHILRSYPQPKGLEQDQIDHETHWVSLAREYMSSFGRNQHKFFIKFTTEQLLKCEAKEAGILLSRWLKHNIISLDDKKALLDAYVERFLNLPRPKNRGISQYTPADEIRKVYGEEYILALIYELPAQYTLEFLGEELTSHLASSLGIDYTPELVTRGIITPEVCEQVVAESLGIDPEIVTRIANTPTAFSALDASRQTRLHGVTGTLDRTMHIAFR